MSNRASRGNRLLVTTMLTSFLLLLSMFTASPSQATFATKITITAITPAYNIPNTIGDYPLVTTGDPFSVSISTDGWASLLGPTPLVLTAASGPEAGKVLAKTTLPALSTTAKFTGAVLTKEALGVQLKAAVDKPNSSIQPGFANVDVLGDFTAAPATTQQLSIGGSTSGVSAPCEVSSSAPFCVEMLGGAVSDQLLAIGVCDTALGCVKSPTITWLANIDKVQQLVLKCHKSLCPGTGVPNFIVNYQLTRDAASSVMLDCPTPATVAADGNPCVASGNRYGAGNLVLFVNWRFDGRIVIGK